jgi:NADH-quinone oxidoreductase subunit I
MIGKGLLKGLGITFKHTFEKDKTIQYPEQRPFLHNRFRGCLEFEADKCIACGLCAKACPNNVLEVETATEEGSKKKKLVRYNIDLQYCMFCNLCVEACPHDCLRFNHNFELTQGQRSDIKMSYEPSHHAEQPSTEPDAAEDEALRAKRIKQLEAMKTALLKSPDKTLARILDQPDDIPVLAELLKTDEKRLTMIAELMLNDREKARKVGQALVNQQKKAQEKEGKQLEH